MNAKQLITIATLAFAGSAAMADDITIVKDDFVAQKSRAEVRAEVLEARAAGVVFAASEADVGAPVLATSTLTRDQVRAELRNAPKSKLVVFNPAA
jgi:hypothetical protein